MYFIIICRPYIHGPHIISDIYILEQKNVCRHYTRAASILLILYDFVNCKFKNMPGLIMFCPYLPCNNKS